jgi:hypothetical protein
LRKKPATAEFLVWLSVLSVYHAEHISAKELRSMPLRELPALATLVKDREDQSKL